MLSVLDLMALSAGETATFTRKFGWPRYRAHQVLRWLYQRRVTDVDAMTDLSKADRARLTQHAYIGTLTPESVRTSEDGAQKFVFPLDDGKGIESVVIPDEDRLTLCLSTQIGCTLDCAFCLTGRMGLSRNLKPQEIVGQVLAVQRHLSHPPTPGETTRCNQEGRVPRHTPSRSLTNLVLMGMGEPLANPNAVEEAAHRFTNRAWGLGFSPRRITLSTAGLAPRLKRVAELGVNLAVSLNAATNVQRDRLMPAVNKAYPLETLMAACRTLPLKPHRRLTFEYVLLAGENDTEQDAVRLVKLVRGLRCKINLIPFNEFPESPFRRPSDETVLRFQAILIRSGLDTFIRKSKGRDILGACGQLGTLSEPALLAPIQQHYVTA